MRFAKSAFEVVKAHAEQRGCPDFEPNGHYGRFVDKARTKFIRVMEVQATRIFLDDSECGRVTLPRRAS
jgi:hypothetical protein